MPAGKEKARIQVIVSKEIAERIDFYANKMGLSRSALCCQFIGQSVMGYDKAFEMVTEMGTQMLAAEPGGSNPVPGKKVQTSYTESILCKEK